MGKKFIVWSIIFLSFGININAEEIGLNEISISANRTATKLNNIGSSVTVLTRDDISNSTESHLIDYIAQIPGVSSSQNGPKGSASGLTLRGLGLQYIKVLVDGIDVGDVSSIPVMANISGIMLDDLERIEVLQGSQSALYGSSAIGGVIAVTTKKGAAQTSSFTGEIGAYGTLFMSVGKNFSNEKSDIFASGSFLSTDGFSAKSGGNEADGYKSRKISASGNYYISDSNTLTLQMFAQEEDGDQDGYDDVSFEFIDKDDEVFSSESLGLATNLEINSGTVLRNIGIKYFNVDRFYTGPYNYEGKNVEISFQEERKFGDSLFVSGLSVEKAETLIEVVNKDISQAHLFGEYIYNDSDSISFTASGRVSNHSEFEGSSTGRLTASYKSSAGPILRTSVGTGFRAPSLFELFAPYYGNADLRPETSTTIDLGFKIPIATEKSSISGTIFETTISDRIVYNYDTYAYGQSDIDEKRTGYELSANYKFDRNLFLSVSFTHTEDGNGNRVQKVPESDLIFSAGVKLESGLSLNGSIQRVSGLEDFVSLPDYSLVSVRASYPFTKSVDIYLRGENLFDADYETASGYQTSGRVFYTGFKAEF